MPIFHLDVWWSKHSYAFLGNTLKRSKVKHQPKVKLSNAGPVNPIKELCLVNAQYVFTMTDPDMPRRDLPSDSEYAQWIGLATASANSFRNGHDANGYITCADMQVKEWETILKYKRPHPRNHTGKHRYIFEAFTPINGTMEKLSLAKPGHRKRWGYMEEGYGAKEWAAAHQLMPVGKCLHVFMFVPSEDMADRHPLQPPTSFLFRTIGSELCLNSQRLEILSHGCWNLESLLVA